METTRRNASLPGRCLVAIYRLQTQSTVDFDALLRAVGEAELDVLEALLELDQQGLVVLEELRLTLEGLAVAAAASSAVRLSRTGLTSVRFAA